MSRPAKNSTEVLKAAKWILENVGWAQAVYEKHEGDVFSGKVIAYCAEGALDAVETVHFTTRLRAYKRLEKAIGGGKSIVGFNDHKKTTKKKVLNAFDRAIKKGAK